MSPVIENGMLIAHLGGHDKGALTAFDVETGKVKWTNDLDGPAYASPMVVTLGGVRQVVNFTQKELIGVDVGNGKLLWRMPAKSQYEENSVTIVPYKDMLIVSREGMGLSAIRLEKENGAAGSARSLEHQRAAVVFEFARASGKHARWNVGNEEGTVLCDRRRHGQDALARSRSHG